MGRRIHIVGSSPRTGTTLMAELMTSGFVVDRYEPEHEVSIFRRPAPGFDVYCSKNPGDVRVVRPLLWLDRNLWVVHMVRDPRDVVVSRHGKAPQQYYTNLRVWRSRRAAVRKLEGRPRFLTVRYEDLVRDPDRVQEWLLDRMPFLERRSRFSEYHDRSSPSTESVLALKGVRPITTDSIGVWRQHRPRVAAQIALHGPIDDDLIGLGYEPDATWSAALNGVEPDNGVSYLPEQMPPTSLRRQLRNSLRVIRYAAETVRDRLRFG